MATGPNYNLISPFSATGTTVVAYFGTTTFSGQAQFANGSTTAPSAAVGTSTAGLFFDTVGGGLGVAVGGNELILNNPTTVIVPQGLVLIGNTSSGALLKNNGTNQLYVQQQNGSSYTYINAAKFLSQGTSASNNVAIGGANGSAINGIYFADTSSMGISTNGTTAAVFNSSQQLSNVKVVAASKGGTTYTTAAGNADSFTVFDNAGTSTLTTFQLLPVVPGAMYTFASSGAGTITVTPNASDTIALTGKSAGSVVSCTAAKGNYLQLVGSATANTWIVTNNNGFS